MNSTVDAKPAPLSLKPDLADAAQRWAAFYAGEIIDRPVVCVTAPQPGAKPPPGSSYHDRVFLDLDELVDRMVRGAEATYFGGEAIPTGWTSFGPDEVAVFCGAELAWSADSGDTNWSVPFVEDWEKALPLRLHSEHPLWQRMLEFYRRAARRTAGKMLLAPLDLHTNMDLLAAIRGPQRLCLDLVEQPETIDRAMADARRIFPEVWRAVAEAAQMDERGYCAGIYSMAGAAFLQCDFCCMMGPPMFRRWVLPALEEEATIVRHCVYHWDGPGALMHERDLVTSRGLHCMSYVPTPGQGGHPAHIELFKRVQAAGRAVHVWGSPDEVKAIHRELRPEKVFYCTNAASPAAAEELLAWFKANT